MSYDKKKRPYTKKKGGNTRIGETPEDDGEQAASETSDIPQLKLRSHNKKSASITKPNQSTSTEASGLVESNIKSKELGKRRKKSMTSLDSLENEVDLNIKDSDLENNNRKMENMKTAVIRQKQNRKRKSASLNLTDCFKSTILSPIKSKPNVPDAIIGSCSPKHIYDEIEIHNVIYLHPSMLKTENEETQSIHSDSVFKYDYATNFDTTVQTEDQHLSPATDQGLLPNIILNSKKPQSVSRDTASKMNGKVKEKIIRTDKHSTFKKAFRTEISTTLDSKRNEPVKTPINKKSTPVKIKPDNRKKRLHHQARNSPIDHPKESQFMSCGKKSQKLNEKKPIKKKLKRCEKNVMCSRSPSISRELLGFDKNIEYIEDIFQEEINTSDTILQALPVLNECSVQISPLAKITKVKNPLLPYDITFQIGNITQKESSNNTDKNVIAASENLCNNALSECSKNEKLNNFNKNIKSAHRHQSKVNLSSLNEINMSMSNTTNQSKSDAADSNKLNDDSNNQTQSFNSIDTRIFNTNLKKSHFFVAGPNSEKNIGKIDKTIVANVIFNFNDVFKNLNAIHSNGFSNDESSLISNLMDFEPTFRRSPSPQNTEATDREVPNTITANKEIVNLESQSVVNDTLANGFDAPLSSGPSESDDDDAISLDASSILSYCSNVFNQVSNPPYKKNVCKTITLQKPNIIPLQNSTTLPQTEQMPQKTGISKITSLQTKSTDNDFDFKQPYKNHQNSNWSGILSDYCEDFITDKCDNVNCPLDHQDARSLFNDISERLANAQKEEIASAYSLIRLHTVLCNFWLPAFLKVSAEKIFTDLFLNMVMDICRNFVNKKEIALRDCTYFLTEHELPIWQHADLLLAPIPDGKDLCPADILLKTCSNELYSQRAWLVIRLTLVLKKGSKLVQPNTMYKLLENLLKENLSPCVYKEAYETFLMKVPDRYLESISYTTLRFYIEKLKSVEIPYYKEFSMRLDKLWSHGNSTNSNEPHCTKTLSNPNVVIPPESVGGFINAQPTLGSPFHSSKPVPQVSNGYRPARPMPVFIQSNINNHQPMFNRLFLRHPPPEINNFGPYPNFNGFRGSPNSINRPRHFRRGPTYH